MFQIIRTTYKNVDYQSLVIELDNEILKRDGKDFEFYNQFNSSENLNEVVLIMDNNRAIGCGTIKRYDNEKAEIKRMFTAEESRGKGVATLILKELEKWACELGYNECILETGRKYTEAIALYQKHGFKITENYGQYAGVEDSVCFIKRL